MVFSSSQHIYIAHFFIGSPYNLIYSGISLSNIQMLEKTLSIKTKLPVKNVRLNQMKKKKK